MTQYKGMLTSPLQQASSKNGNPWLTGRSSGFFKKQTFTNLRNSCYSHSVYYQNTRSPIDRSSGSGPVAASSHSPSPIAMCAVLAFYHSIMRQHSDISRRINSHFWSKLRLVNSPPLAAYFIHRRCVSPSPRIQHKPLWRTHRRVQPVPHTRPERN